MIWLGTVPSHSRQRPIVALVERKGRSKMFYVERADKETVHVRSLGLTMPARTVRALQGAPGRRSTYQQTGSAAA
jgi:hypothetical protein